MRARNVSFKRLIVLADSLMAKEDRCWLGGN